MSLLSDHVAYREAVASVVEHRLVQHAAELAVLRYKPQGDDDPRVAELVAARDKAVADVRWCQALVIACGEVVKGCTFEEANRSKIDRILNVIDEGIAT